MRRSSGSAYIQCSLAKQGDRAKKPSFLKAMAPRISALEGGRPFYSLFGLGRGGILDETIDSIW